MIRLRNQLGGDICNLSSSQGSLELGILCHQGSKRIGTQESPRATSSEQDFNAIFILLTKSTLGRNEA